MRLSIEMSVHASIYVSLFCISVYSLLLWPSVLQWAAVSYTLCDHLTSCCWCVDISSFFIMNIYLFNLNLTTGNQLRENLSIIQIPEGSKVTRVHDHKTQDQHVESSGIQQCSCRLQTTRLTLSFLERRRHKTCQRHCSSLYVKS